MQCLTPVLVMLMVTLSCAETVERENNKDYNQVLLDVQRSLRRFPPGEYIPYLLREVFHEALLCVCIPADTVIHSQMNTHQS